MPKRQKGPKREKVHSRTQLTKQTNQAKNRNYRAHSEDKFENEIGQEKKTTNETIQAKVLALQAVNKNIIREKV